MENIYTNTNATFTTANGETVSYQEIFESVRKSVEIYGKAGGRDLSAEELEDLFQDSILKALKYCKRFDPTKAQAKTWASRIAFNETKTRKITYIHGATKDVFTGFVAPYAIINTDYEIKVQMRGENTTVQIDIPRESEIVNDDE